MERQNFNGPFPGGEFQPFDVICKKSPKKNILSKIFFRMPSKIRLVRLFLNMSFFVFLYRFFFVYAKIRSLYIIFLDTIGQFPILAKFSRITNSNSTGGGLVLVNTRFAKCGDNWTKIKYSENEIPDARLSTGCGFFTMFYKQQFKQNNIF